MTILTRAAFAQISIPYLFITLTTTYLVWKVFHPFSDVQDLRALQLAAQTIDLVIYYEIKFAPSHRFFNCWPAKQSVSSFLPSVVRMWNCNWVKHAEGYMHMDGM